MSERIELPKMEVRRWEGEEWPAKRITIADSGTSMARFISTRFTDLDESQAEASEIARRCNNWLEVADNVACLLSAIEHSVDKDENYDMDMAPHIEELERLIGGEA